MVTVDWDGSRVALLIAAHHTGSAYYVRHLLQRVAAAGRHVAKALCRHLLIATKPAAAPRVVRTLADLARSKPELIAAPKEYAICERFLGSVRRECLDHLLVLSETHLRRILLEYLAYFNRDRPHQGLEQQIPDPLGDACPVGPVRATPVLGGLQHTYRRAA